MKTIDYKDESGQWFVVLIPDDAPNSNAKYGIVLGPPIRIRLHNELFARRIITIADAKRNRVAVQSALLSVFALDSNRIVQEYDNGSR
jgi:hypothetical protein